MQITVIDSPKCALHNMDPHHPESPSRLHAVNDQLISSGIDAVLHRENAPKIEQHLLYNAHHPEFVDSLFNHSPSDKDEHVWLDEDTIMMNKTLDAACYAAGAGKKAVDLVMHSHPHMVFCSVRPPGHHAGTETASGFCFFNNIAVAAKYALNERGLSRVAIIDFDVHHGNGTEEIVQHDSRIHLISAFQHPFYPHSGGGESAENVNNIPIDAGTRGAEYREILMPYFDALDQYAPEMIFVSAGFDAHVEEELGDLCLTENDYYWLAQQINGIAKRHANGRVVSMLEGGYALSALGRSVVSFLKGFMD